MQDRDTGEMMALNSKQFQKEAKNDLAEALKNEADRILPKNRQGPIFQVGEELEIKGGRFRIRSIGKEGMALVSLPGTHIQAGD